MDGNYKQELNVFNNAMTIISDYYGTSTSLTKKCKQFISSVTSQQLAIHYQQLPSPATSFTMCKRKPCLFSLQNLAIRRPIPEPLLMPPPTEEDLDSDNSVMTQPFSKAFNS